MTDASEAQKRHAAYSVGSAPASDVLSQSGSRLGDPLSRETRGGRIWPPSTTLQLPLSVIDACSRRHGLRLGTAGFGAAGFGPDRNPSAPKQVVNDPARTGFDPQMKWWMNYFRILTGQMTPEGQFHYREWRYKVHEERDCKRCEEYRDWLFTYSPVVRFMSEKIQDLNGKLDPSNVLCRRCPARLDEDGQVRRQSGGFSPNHGILLCANEIRDRKHLEDTLAHEMIHAWDHLRWKVDWMGDKDLKHAACTEIRASMLSGECRWTREAFTRGNWSVTQQFQNCVRRRAINSVLARPRCKDQEQAAKVVDQVWDSCFSDTRPFDEVYR